MRIVIALGGNALLRRGETPTAATMYGDRNGCGIGGAATALGSREPAGKDAATVHNLE